MSDESTRVSVRVSNPELVAAIEDAEEELGSRSEAVRTALETTYLGDGDDVETASEHDLPLKVIEGYRQLVDWTGVGGRVELDTAESILAEALKVTKDAIRRTVIRPLRREGVIELHQGIHHVSIVVGTLEKGGRVEATSNTTEPVATDGGDIDADDVENAGDRLDELAGAEVGR